MHSSLCGNQRQSQLKPHYTGLGRRNQIARVGSRFRDLDRPYGLRRSAGLFYMLAKHQGISAYAT
jgi:hypothetical protein